MKIVIKRTLVDIDMPGFGYHFVALVTASFGYHFECCIGNLVPIVQSCLLGDFIIFSSSVTENKLALQSNAGTGLMIHAPINVQSHLLHMDSMC